MPSGRETELIERAERGDVAAATEVVRQHWDELFRVADLILRDRFAAEDVVQEAFVSAFAGLEGFDRARGLRPWLVGIVTNQAIDETRRRKRAPVASPDLLDEPVTADQVTAPSRNLREALESLDAESRAILVLRHVLDYRSGEIAELLGMSAGGVRTRLKRSLDDLRNVLTMEA